ncbi:HEAT repeat domain-containing protein [bacterium]|nr:MAG: HEAT repeat domain-containing protein [bacterium]
MKKPAPISANARSSLVWAGAGLLEFPLVCVLAAHPTPLPLWAVTLLHLFAAALTFFAPPRGKGWFLPTRHWGESLALAVLLLPGFGWLAAGWLLWYSGEMTAHKEAYRFDQDAPEDTNPLAALGTPAAIRRELADALDVLPAADALLSNDPALKRGAIETLARIRTPDSIGWILRARTDPDPEVRFYATSALTRLKGEYETGVRAAERESVLQPGDPALRLAIHRVRYEYAVSGILDAPARASILADCRVQAAGQAARDPEAARLAFLVERAIDPAGAFPALERLERLDPGRTGRWLRERVELCFLLGRHAETARLLKERRAEALADSSGDREWQSAVLWWTDG